MSARLTIIHLLAALLMLPLVSCSSGRGASPEPAPASFEQAIDRGNDLMRSQVYDAALDEYLKAMDIAEAAGSEVGKAEALCAITEVDIQTFRDAQAWEHACQAEEIARREGFQKELAKALILKGRICVYAEVSEDNNRNDEGLGYLTEALEVSQRAGLKAEEALSWIEMGQIYVNKNRWNTIVDKALYRKAGECFASAEAIAGTLQDNIVRKRLITSQARYFRQGGEYQKAIALLEEALKDWPEDDYTMYFGVSDQLAALYAGVGDLESTLQSHSSSIYYAQQMSRQKAETSLQEMETKYETSLKDQKITLQQAQIRRRHIVIVMMSLMLLLCVILLVIVNYYRAQTRRRNAELAEANATKDGLFSIISHDIKNPAIAQRNAIRSLVDVGGMLDAATMKACHEDLLKSAESEVTLVQNLLDWARAQAGKIKFNPTTFPFAALVADELNAHAKLLEGKKIRAVVEVADDIMVCADRDLAAITVRNLLVNAVKYSREGGEVKISAVPEGEMVSCSVADSGTGIKQEALATIFDQGVKKSVSGTGGELGTGLGLSVCQSFVIRNGGAISVSSREGEGSTFTFTLKKA